MKLLRQASPDLRTDRAGVSGSIARVDKDRQATSESLVRLQKKRSSRFHGEQPRMGNSLEIGIYARAGGIWGGYSLIYKRH